MSTLALDSAKAEAFGDRLLQTLNGAAVGIMISVGHKTGLFDAMAELPPTTSDRIAAAANLRERYVREWLGAMVTGGVVEYDADTRTYHLPPEHASMLTRSAEANFAATFQFLPQLGTVEEQVIRCFREGGGVPYCAYCGFHSIMAEESEQTVVRALFEHILPLAEGAMERLEEGIDVLDLGCGRAHALMAMAERYPASRFRGLDLSEEAIDWARNCAAERGLDNVEFVVRDATTFDETAAYDLITTFDSIHDQAHPDTVLAAIHRALRPGGTYLMQDIAVSSHLEKNIGHPIAPFVYTISCMHCMTVSLAQGGVGLGAAWGEELAVMMLREAGFDKVEVRKLDHDIQNNFYIMRK